MTLLAIIYFLFILLIIYFEASRRPAVPLDFFRLFSFFFVLNYPLQGALFSLNPDYWMSERYSFTYGESPLLVFSSIALSYLLVTVGYHAFNSANRITIFIPENKRELPVVLWSLLFLFIFLLLAYFYTSFYGGVTGAISAAESLRAGFGERHSFAFLKRFFWFCPLAVVLSGTALIFNRRTVLVYIVFFSSLAGLVFSSTLLASRSAMMEPIAALAIAYTYKSGKFFDTRTTFVVFFILAFILVGDNFWGHAASMVENHEIKTASMDPSANIFQITSDILRNFQAPYVSLEAYASEYSLATHGLRYGLDIPLAVASLAPDTLIGISFPETIASFNTLMVRGEYKSIIPPGMVAFSLYSFSFSGLLVIPLIYGAVGCLITTLAFSAWYVWWVKAGYGVVALALAMSFQSGEPKVLLENNLYIGFMLVFLFGLGYLRLAWRN